MKQSAARKWVATKQSGAVVSIVADIWRGMPGFAHPCAARAGAIHLSKSMVVEGAPFNIRVNCVAPGCCPSNDFGNHAPEGAAAFAESNPMHRVGNDADTAEVVVCLAAPSAQYITGEVLTVDGGRQLRGDPWPNGWPDYFKAS